MSESVVTYRGSEESWGVIWQAVGTAMISPAFTPEAREQITKARKDILDTTSDPKDNSAQPDTTIAALVFGDIHVGRQYKYKIPNGKFALLNGKTCTIIKKGRTRLETILDEDVPFTHFKKGHKLTVYPGHLTNV